MQINLGDMYAVDWGGRPQHMSQKDLLLWRIYEPMIRSRYLGYYYDVQLIPDIILPPETTPSMKKVWYAASAKRIDVLAVTKKGFDIIELRDLAGVSAVSAVEVYILLLRQSYLTAGEIRGIIVSDYPDPLLFTFAAAKGIEVVKLGI